MNQLEQLKKFSIAVADTSDLQLIHKHTPQEATTNPSLILAASKNKDYFPLIEEAISYAKTKAPSSSEILPLALDKVLVNFGKEILKMIPGRVSIEVDARLSFDTEKSIKKAKNIIALFQENNIAKERILIKLATTWEGIVAAKELEKEGIHCNMTLLFCLPQAVAAAEAKATLISPFVGRILDWYQKNDVAFDIDPGVASVQTIFHYFKKYHYPTQIMGASFRNTDQILNLAGCDLLTISPKFLDQLSQEKGNVLQKLFVENAPDFAMDKMTINEKTFRYLLNADAMASEKLSEGIRKFCHDIATLENLLREHL